MDERIALHQHLSKPRPTPTICGCLGPRSGEPLCPCGMKWCEQVNGKWYKIDENITSEKVAFTVTEVTE
ncbi:MAG: hypothetical protein EBU90_14055 [Proteobacteria bacterium]|nr:hypothetical protein [Pseudomonadota bacterium]